MNLNAQFPQVTSPFVNQSGRIDQAWLQLLITLWNRTGGGSGTGSIKSITFDNGLTATPNPLVDGNNPVSEATLAKIPVGDLLANIGVSGDYPSSTGLSALLDFVFGLAENQIIYRGVSTWTTEVSPVIAGMYTNATVSVDERGIVTFAASGVAPSNTIYAPLVSGATPGPVLIANTVGECIMVPIT